MFTSKVPKYPSHSFLRANTFYRATNAFRDSRLEFFSNVICGWGEGPERRAKSKTQQTEIRRKQNKNLYFTDTCVTQCWVLMVVTVPIYRVCGYILTAGANEHLHMHTLIQSDRVWWPIEDASLVTRWRNTRAADDSKFKFAKLKRNCETSGRQELKYLQRASSLDAELLWSLHRRGPDILADVGFRSRKGECCFSGISFMEVGGEEFS